MTNGDWIRSLTDEELEKYVINPCKNYECGECPMYNMRGRCVVEAGKAIAMEWLESEYMKRTERA